MLKSIDLFFMSGTREHFNKIADKYDTWKKKNWYYYCNLKALYRENIPPGAGVLEIGCGTGDILASLGCGRGAGLDISDEMIEIAKRKYGSVNNLAFYAGTAETLELNEKFDYIFLADVIEHLDNVNSTVGALKKFCRKDTKIIISMANPLWEPLLMMMEKLRLKMPEGPHQRISIKELKNIFKDNNFTVTNEGFRTLVPFYIPAISDFLNKYFYKVPILAKMGLIYFCEVKLYN